METIAVKDDIKVMYVQAGSFPDGVLAAHQQLRALIPFSTDRKYLGISRPENGTIQYKAAMEEVRPGEAEEKGLPTLVLKGGNYISLMVYDFMKNTQGIGQAFRELLAHSGLDPQGYCVEWYVNDKDVQCMIRLEN
ncbi:hypothetical protein ACTHGU_03980 [Chitinophagaceae bacterium MMS25-I14]